MTQSYITNPFSTLMTDPVRNFKFLVKFLPIAGAASDTANKWTSDLTAMGFVSVSGLSIATEAIAYREGGYNTTFHQLPGQSSFTPITLSKGVLLSQSASANWMKRLFSTLSAESGTAATGAGSTFRCDLEIQVLTHPNPGGFGAATTPTASQTPYDQHTSLLFKVHNAWITNLSYSNLDAGANTLMVEEMQLVHEGFDVAYAADYNTTAKF